MSPLALILPDAVILPVILTPPSTVSNFEPRVANLGVEINSQPDINSMEVTVIFDIVGLQVPTQSFTFLLEPTR